MAHGQGGQPEAQSGMGSGEVGIGDDDIGSETAQPHDVLGQPAPGRGEESWPWQTGIYFGEITAMAQQRHGMTTSEDVQLMTLCFKSSENRARPAGMSPTSTMYKIGNACHDFLLLIDMFDRCVWRLHPDAVPCLDLAVRRVPWLGTKIPCPALNLQIINPLLPPFLGIEEMSGKV